MSDTYIKQWKSNKPMYQANDQSQSTRNQAKSVTGSSKSASGSKASTAQSSLCVTPSLRTTLAKHGPPLLHLVSTLDELGIKTLEYLKCALRW
jgi:hypothetical protein